MTQRPTHVPKFGNWDANDHVPFTVVFDNARARKGGKIMNPNDPMENPAAFGLTSEPLPPFESKEDGPPARVPGKGFPQQFSEETSPFPESQHESSKEDNHNKPPREQHADLPVRRPSGNAQGYYRPGMTGGQVRPSAADGFRRGSSGGGVREDGGTELGGGENPVADQSPNHQAAYQGRLGNRQGSAWERKVPSEGGSVSAAANAGKARQRPGSTRGDETPDRGPALPKFGAWDEKDPSSGEGFTVIFNQARNEKKAGGPVRIPPLQAESPARMDYSDASKPYQSEHNYASQKKSLSNWTCCFQSSTRD